MGKTAAAKPEKSGTQLDLIDVKPENAKAIIAAAREYKEFQAARLTILAKEVAQKQRVLELVKAAELKPVNGGKIKFEYEGVAVSITPRDALIKVKDKANKNPEK